MRIKVRHQTDYHYGQPARSALQLLRMTPRSHEGQFVRRWRVEVDADARLDKSEDAYGNITHLIYVEGPVASVRILIDGEVDTTDTGGFTLGSVERQPPRLFLRETALTLPSPQIRAFAAGIAASQGGDLVASLHKIMGELQRGMEFRVGATSTTTTAEQAFLAKAGVCQDFAHIFCVAARALGVPARYVGGYYLRTDTIDQDAGHAWAEAYLNGLGWLGFDPANGLCVTDRYVRVAVGCDYLDAAPVRGAQTGGTDEALSVAIQIQQGQAIAQD